MTSSSSEPGVALPATPPAGTGTVTPVHAAELRSGAWTRLGSGAILGDAVTERILADLAEQAKSAGRAQGYAHGWAEGRRAAGQRAREEMELVAARQAEAERRRADEHERALGALLSAAASLHAATDRVCQMVQQQASGLAFALVEQILGRELAIARDPGGDAVRRALALLPTEAVVTVRLHPDDLAGAVQACPATARVVPDPALERGDAVVETDSGVVDARVATALARVREVWQ